MADEATKANVTPEFFAQHSVQELAEMSDYQLNGFGRIASPVILEKGFSITLTFRGMKPLTSLLNG